MPSIENIKLDKYLKCVDNSILERTFVGPYSWMKDVFRKVLDSCKRNRLGCVEMIFKTRPMGLENYLESE